MSKAINSALDSDPQVIQQLPGIIDSSWERGSPQVIRGALHILTQLKGHPKYLGEVAYRWCAMIWRNRGSYKYWEDLLLLSLEVGFRHIRPPDAWYLPLPPLTGTEPHREMFNTVLKRNNNEEIADLAWASFMLDRSGRLWLNTLADYIVGLNGGATEPSPQGVVQTFIFCVESMGLDALEDVGKERFVVLLNHLHIGIRDLVLPGGCKTWSAILLEITQSAKEAQDLAIQSWELLAELATKGYFRGATYNPGVATSLVGAGMWDKLECWLGIVWVAWPQELGSVAEGLEDAMKALEKERRGALRERMERWSERHRRDLPESFRQTYSTLTP